MRSLCAALLAASLLVGCTLGPVWSRRLEGRVLDAKTQAPVAGALVTATHEIALLMTHGNSNPVDGGWTRSDADGYFALPGRLVVRPLPYAVTMPNPDVYAFHPEYGEGWAYLPRDGRDEVDRLALEIQLDVRDHDLDGLLDAEYPREICRRRAESERGCQQLCRSAYADAAHCAR